MNEYGISDYVISFTIFYLVILFRDNIQTLVSLTKLSVSFHGIITMFVMWVLIIFVSPIIIRRLLRK